MMTVQSQQAALTAWPLQVSKPSGKEGKDAKEAPAAATPAKGPADSSPEPSNLPAVANLLQFVAWAVWCNRPPQQEEPGGLASHASGMSRKAPRFLASQLSPVQEAAIRCQVTSAACSARLQLGAGWTRSCCWCCCVLAWCWVGL